MSPQFHQPLDWAEGLSAMRNAIAAAMARSKWEIPHYYLAHQIEMTAIHRRLGVDVPDGLSDSRHP